MRSYCRLQINIIFHWSKNYGRKICCFSERIKLSSTDWRCISRQTIYFSTIWRFISYSWESFGIFIKKQKCFLVGHRIHQTFLLLRWSEQLLKRKYQGVKIFQNQKWAYEKDSTSMGWPSTKYAWFTCFQDKLKSLLKIVKDTTFSHYLSKGMKSNQIEDDPSISEPCLFTAESDDVKFQWNWAKKDNDICIIGCGLPNTGCKIQNSLPHCTSQTRKKQWKRNTKFESFGLSSLSFHCFGCE